MNAFSTSGMNEHAHRAAPLHHLGPLNHEALLMEMSEYPKILICSLSRIHRRDRQSNNLLLRNLFADWPRERLAQIYSGGERLDEGFCGRSRQLTEEDRRWGSVFFGLKGKYTDTAKTAFGAEACTAPQERATVLSRLKHSIGIFCMETGLYELIFTLRPSRSLLAWVNDFAPDIIFAQGYSLSFVLLPLMLKRHLNLPIAYYASDDWPAYLYRSTNVFRSAVSYFVRRELASATMRLLRESEMPFSFNPIMGEEYERRYGRPFIPLMLGDNPERFQKAEEIRLQLSEVCSIVATGGFDDSRWPLLLDLEEACRRLNRTDICVKATVLASNISAEGYRQLRMCHYVELRDDPGHDALPSYLKGADILFLPETFDPVLARACRYSISTKAHLFMFSRKPILVYGHAETGLVAYARNEGWAHVVERRNIAALTVALGRMVRDAEMRRSLISSAERVTMANHDSAKIRRVFMSRLTNQAAGEHRIA
jgi:hypothetical protein